MYYKPVIRFLTFLGECSILIWQTLCRLFRKPHEWWETLQQMAFVGVFSIPIVALTTFFSGAVLGLYSTQMLIKFGVSSLIGGAISLSSTREISPVLTGIMVAARCGSAMTAQIGSMVVTEQVDALRSLRVHPINYLVIPRIIACVTMLPILTLLGMYAAIFGGYLVALSSGLSAGSFLQSIRSNLTPWDYEGGLIKSIVFGAIIGVISCQQGLRTRKGARGVGKATTNSVVISMVLIYIANYFLSKFLYSLKS